MADLTLTRRDLFALSSTPLLADAAPAGADGPAGSRGVPPALDRFAAAYVRAMNAPGMTLALASTDGVVGLATYGYADLGTRAPVTTAHRFQIGSITKSFAALVVLQLQDEGRLDVQHPILRHLPWLPIDAPFGEIRIHHLLSHTSGMPEDAPLFAADQAYRVRQTCAPGTRFGYSNWAYDAIGYLIEAIDGRPWAEAVTHRILRPLGMTDTAAAITNARRARLPQSYVPLHDDRPYPRHGAITPALNITFESAAGSIASTPADMALYMRMLLRGGMAPSGRLVSPDAFRMFTSPYAPAPPFGPGASYGYGIAMRPLDGHRRLLHTGGMEAFMSSIQLDLDEGVAAFASINAQLGYRPNPVTEYALRVMRATAEGRRPPAAPKPDEAADVADPTAYAGTYVAADGRRLGVRARGARLQLVRDGRVIPLQQAAPDQFIVDHADFATFMLLFGRRPAASQGDRSPAPVIELLHGPDWYAREGVTAEPEVPSPVELAPYIGIYCADGLLNGIVRVVARRGRLWLDGTTPLQPAEAHAFTTEDEPPGRTRVEFRALVAGKAQLLVVPDNALFGTGVLRRIHDVDGAAAA